MNELISLLIWLLVAGVVLYVINLVISMVALPAQIKTIALIIVGLVFLVFLLRHLGLWI